MSDIVERLREKAPPSAVPSWSDTYRKCVEAADEIERLRGQIDAFPTSKLGLLASEIARENETLRAAGSPGVLHAVDQAFYDLTIQQRDTAWREIETLRGEIERLRGENDTLRTLCQAAIKELSEGLT